MKIREADRSLGKSIRLMIVGDGPQLEALQSKIEKAGLSDLVWLPGALDEIPNMIREMDIFVLPSRNEGISNTLLEAMACGKPVVATNVGGTPEILHDGHTGFLVDANRVDEMVSKIRDYVRNPRLRVLHGNAARERVLSSFSLDVMVEKYIEAYDRLIGFPNPNR